MISVTVMKSRNEYVGFTCSGHAGFAKSGEDLVCCAISTLVINTINSIEKLTDTHFNVDSDEKTGFIDFKFIDKPSSDASLLIKSMVLGIESVIEEYGKFVRLKIKEV